jgi:hypothetical protein
MVKFDQVIANSPTYCFMLRSCSQELKICLTIGHHTGTIPQPVVLLGIGLPDMISLEVAIGNRTSAVHPPAAELRIYFLQVCTSATYLSGPSCQSSSIFIPG